MTDAPNTPPPQPSAAPAAAARGAPASACRRRSLRRRGSIYAMVLGITMLITVIGVGALATSRVAARGSGAATDWQEAGALAFSAVEHAVAKLNADAPPAPDTWRDAYTSGQIGFTAPLGGGTMSWALVDEEDGSVKDHYGDPLKVYGIGRVGAVRRVYSARLTPVGGGVDVLRTAAHASGSVSLGGATVVVGGPLSANGSLSGLSYLRGNGGSEVAGAGGNSVAPAKRMPEAAVFDMYKARATAIDSAAAAEGTLQPGTLSAASNPYGARNAEGIYYLRLPATIGTLTLMSSRYKATLLIEGAGQGLVIAAPMLWEPHSTELPTLITRGITSVTINGSISPYNDGSTLHPSELRGLFHLIGSTAVQVNDAAYVRGCLLADGSLMTSGTVGFTADPALLANPPLGYSSGNRLLLVPGSWKWDEPPAP